MLLFRLTDAPGNLAAALAAFTRQGVNVTYIQSSADGVAGQVMGAGVCASPRSARIPSSRAGRVTG
jgi:hypothetical protein